MGFKFKKYILLFILLLVSLFIRTYELDTVPPGLFYDETLDSYNAYSIMKTGKDFMGKDVGITISAHGGVQNEPLYTLMLIPFVALFGLKTVSVRLLGALIGTLIVLFTYLFTKDYFEGINKSTSKKNSYDTSKVTTNGVHIDNETLALIAATIVCFSPIGITLSRLVFRSGLMPLFMLMGLYFLSKSLKNQWYLIPAGFIFGLSIYSYTIMKFASIVTILVFFMFHYNTFFKNINRQKIIMILLFFGIFLMLSFPSYYSYQFSGTNARFNSISIFNEEHPVEVFFTNYITYLSPQTLFIHKDFNLRHSIPGFAQMLIVLFPFLILALYYAIVKKETRILFLVVLYLINLIPASLCTPIDTPHTLRSFNTFPLLEIICAFGLFITYQYLSNYVKKPLYTKIIIVLFTVVFLFNSGVFIHSYFVDFPLESEWWFDYGHNEIIDYAQKNSVFYDNVYIIFSGKLTFASIAFFAPVEPPLVQKYDFGKFKFCTDCLNATGNNLFIVDLFTNDFFLPPGFTILYTVKSKNGYPLYYAVVQNNES